MKPIDLEQVARGLLKKWKEQGLDSVHPCESDMDEMQADIAAALRRVVRQCAATVREFEVHGGLVVGADSKVLAAFGLSEE